MQLDKTEIAIRERNARELFDLSLIVLRHYWWPLMAVSLILFVPLMVIDLLCLSWMMSEDAYLAAETMAGAEFYIRFRFLAHFAGLCLIQFPIMTLPITIFLGSRIFYEPITTGGVVRKLRALAGRSTVVLGVFRLGLVTLAITLLINRSDSSDLLKELLIGGCVCLALLIRSVRPFAPEILALELCPLRSKGGVKRITYPQRSKSLHRLGEADNIGRFIGASIVGTMLFAMVLGTFIFAKGVSSGDWLWSSIVDYIFFPVSIWFVGMFLAVYRFLAYLDTRIRQEGWELELRLKAESSRIAEKRMPMGPTSEEFAKQGDVETVAS